MCPFYFHSNPGPSGHPGTVQSTVSTSSSEVFLDNLYPKLIVCTCGSPKKVSIGQGGRTSLNKRINVDPPAGNKIMTIELDIDPDTLSLHKTVGMGVPNPSLKGIVLFLMMLPYSCCMSEMDIDGAHHIPS